MADDEDYEVNEIQEKKRERPIRQQKVCECDMTKDLLDEVIEIAQCALDEPVDTPLPHKDIAKKVKQALDTRKGGTWHVIVGSHFGGNITNDATTMVNFQIDNIWYLVFRSGPPESQKKEIEEAAA
eukprot:Tbor_TRINITY_DN5305_c1_g7::TRINITY_DN5305_c1_g7_i1::g.4863::m.4863/K10418/DYNLL; dynein light chain LC8-type